MGGSWLLLPRPLLIPRPLANAPPPCRPRLSPRPPTRARLWAGRPARAAMNPARAAVWNARAALLYSLGGWTALGGLIYYSRQENARTGSGSGACGHLPAWGGSDATAVSLREGSVGARRVRGGAFVTGSSAAGGPCVLLASGAAPGFPPGPLAPFPRPGKVTLGAARPPLGPAERARCPPGPPRQSFLKGFVYW